MAYKHALPENMFASWRHGQFGRGWWNTIGTGLDSMDGLELLAGYCIHDVLI